MVMMVMMLKEKPLGKKNLLAYTRQFEEGRPWGDQRGLPGIGEV